MRKIGILGGTFNPIHNGHVQMAIEAYNYLELDEIILIPSGYPYMKNMDEIADGSHRFRMTELAAAYFPYLSVSDIEIKREGPSYTYETIEYFYEQKWEDKIYFIIGADTLYNMESWKKPDFIFLHANIAVKVRDDKDKEDLENQALYLKTRYKTEIIFVPGEKVDISSRLIRNKIKKKEPITGLMADNVVDYIMNNNLYC